MEKGFWKSVFFRKVIVKIIVALLFDLPLPLLVFLSLASVLSVST